MNIILKYSAMALLAVSLFSCSDKDEPNNDVKPEKTATLRVLYNNILYGMLEDQANNYDNWVEWVKKYDPDICVWCEGQTWFKDKQLNQITRPEEMYLPTHWPELAARYGHKYVAIPYRPDAASIVTSKYPIERISDLPSKDFKTTAPGGHYQIKVNGKVINIVPVHLQPVDYELDARDVEKSKAEFGGAKWRLREIEFICKNTIELSKNPEKEYWIMAGDFNCPDVKDMDLAHAIGNNLWWTYSDDPDHPYYLPSKYIYANTPYEDVIRITYPYQFVYTTSHMKNDYMYVTPPLKHRLKRAEVIVDEFIGQPNNDGLSPFTGSDHLPIMADFDFSR